ncbi:hypothetical protein [Vibrio sp. EJY3]|uniref:hypothetical protein n=1 Tax=Vibrio sp. (strain EJY3) TaxID=1116375 RepID=UPI000243B1D0|nr:hypothetical protein [Vibrio sp. EJY3]AEX22407.1 hypothetical protein VEJY3_09635 [Vibrio sp. EJY3]
MYKPEFLEELQSTKRNYYIECHNLINELIDISEKVGGDAGEHLKFGVSRRLSILAESLNALFELTPPDLSELAEREKRNLADAHLHAFLINVSGIIDNMAWSIVYHYKLDAVAKRKHEVGLFHTKFKTHLPQLTKGKVAEFKEWYDFLVSQRHPTAHRIPPYIIPYIETTEDAARDFTPMYIHSHKDGKIVFLHSQLICDLGAVLELTKVLISDIRESYA